MKNLKSVFIICGLCFLFLKDISLADVDTTAYWPVEATSFWNAVYGTVNGIHTEEGDSVGMFDTAGNCYGAGLFRGGYYFLSAFMREEADPAITNDFVIPGFREGDEVIFKIYKKRTGEIYEVSPSSNQPYIYQYHGNYPPVKIDLIYNHSNDNSLASIPAEQAVEEGVTPASPGNSSRSSNLAIISKFEREATASKNDETEKKVSGAEHILPEKGVENARAPDNLANDDGYLPDEYYNKRENLPFSQRKGHTKIIFSEALSKNSGHMKKKTKETTPKIQPKEKIPSFFNTLSSIAAFALIIAIVVAIRKH